MVAKEGRAAKLQFFRLPMFRLNSQPLALGPACADNKIVYITAIVACRESRVGATIIELTGLYGSVGKD